MLMRIATTITFLMPAFSFADEPAALAPRTPDPVVRRVQINGDGSFVIHVCEAFAVIETRESRVPANRDRLEYKLNGAVLELVSVPDTSEITVQYQVLRQSLNSQSVTLTADKVRAFNLKGETIPAPDLAERFKTPTPAIVSTFENSVVDPTYLSILKDDAVILVISQQLANFDSIAPQAPAPPEASTSPVGATVRKASTLQEGTADYLSADLYKSLLELIASPKEDSRLRSASILECTKIVKNSPARCASFAKVLAKVIAEKDGDFEVRKVAVESTTQLQ